MKGVPEKVVHHIIRCLVAAEMLSVYEEMVGGESENSRELWYSAGKVRDFIDQPRLQNHRGFIDALIHRLRNDLRNNHTTQ